MVIGMVYLQRGKNIVRALLISAVSLAVLVAVFRYLFWSFCRKGASIWNKTSVFPHTLPELGDDASHLVGVFAGIWVGAIPAFSTMAASLLISFTLFVDLNSALALICGVFVGGVYGGAITAILLNIPGAPAAIATGIEGYPLAQRGEAGKAIGLCTTVSVFASFVGILVLSVAAPVIANFSLKFSPRDFFLLAVMGILLIGSIGGGDPIKGITAGAVGVLLSMVGMDPSTGLGTPSQYLPHGGDCS